MAEAQDQKGFVSTDTSKLNPLVRVKATPKIRFINNVEQKRQLGQKISDFELKREQQFRKDLNRKPESLTDKVGNFFNKVIGVQAAEGATLDGKPGFENRGVVTATPESKVASSLSGGSYGGYIDAGSRGFVSPEQAGRMLSNPEAYKMRPSETRYLRESMGLPRASLGVKEGSLLASADPSKIRGISAPAPETKVSETRMAGGFFSPKNFQKSGSPDATIMTREQMGQALTGDPGYSRFGTRDAEGTQAAKDTAAFNQRVKSDFFSPVKADARSIAERREANVQSMRDEARERDTQFRTTGQQTFGGRVGERISGDDTYGTNVMSNPAFGFRSKMSDENKTRYDASAREATRRAEVEPSKGNLIQSTINVGKRIFNTAIGAEGGTPLTKEVPLQKRGEAELKRYEKYLNRPMYQREATARQEAGITNQMTIDKNRAQVRADAEARNKEFQANKRAEAVEKAARRTPENKGSGRDGSFGRGTTGKGMPSNPPGMRQTGVGRSANNLSRHSTGSSANQPSSTPSGDTSFSSYVRGGGVGQQRGDASGMKDTNVKSIAKRQGFNMKTAKGQRAARKAANRAKAQNAAKRRRAAKKKKGKK